MSLCRACLSHDNELHNLFVEFDQGLTLAQILEFNTGFKVKEVDVITNF